MVILKTYTVPEQVRPQRLYDFLPGQIEAITSRKGIKKALKRGCFILNNHPADGSEWIQQGDTIHFVDPETTAPKAYTMALEVIMEDQHLAIINKPAGIEVSGNKYRTIQNAIIGKFESTETDALQWPRPVHRLDAATSGLLIIAKTHSALKALGQQFELKTIQKTYHALCIGKVDPSGSFDAAIGSKPAHTDFKLISQSRSIKNDWLSLVELYPKTGRTHQLRVHLAEAGWPILGDKLYGKKGLILEKKGLFLASIGLSFDHPKTAQRILCKIERPLKFETRIKNEDRRWRQYNV